MSRLKQKIAKKLSAAIGYDVSPTDICFSSGGNRTDVVRWSIIGYECFTSASASAKDDSIFSIAETPKPYGCYEIYVEAPNSNVEITLINGPFHGDTIVVNNDQMNAGCIRKVKDQKSLPFSTSTSHKTQIEYEYRIDARSRTAIWVTP